MARGSWRRRSVTVSWVNWLTGKKASFQDAAFFLSSIFKPLFQASQREFRERFEHGRRFARRFDYLELHLG